MDDQIRILVVDDREQQADGIAKLVAFEQDMHVIGTAETGEQAISQAAEAEPDVVLMDTNLPDMTGLDATQEIKRDNRRIQVILLATERSTDLMREAMRARVSDVVPKPLDAETLYDAIRAAFKNRPPLPPPPDPPDDHDQLVRPAQQGTILTLYSGKGGVGCTTLATNLAVLLHSQEKPAVLVDGDLQFGDVASFLNLPARHSFPDLISHIDALDEEMLNDVLHMHEGGLRVLAAPASIHEASTVTPNDVRDVILDLRSRFGWVIVDTPSAVDDLTINIFEDSDFILNVLTPDIPAIKCSRTFLDLIDVIGITTNKVELLLNMVEKRKGIQADKITDNLKREILAEVPLDRSALLEAVNYGEPPVLRGKTKPFARSIFGLVAAVRNLAVKAGQVEDAAPVQT